MYKIMNIPTSDLCGEIQNAILAGHSNIRITKDGNNTWTLEAD